MGSIVDMIDDHLEEHGGDMEAYLKSLEPEETEVDKAMKAIDEMSHYEMCRLWGFAPWEESEIYFRNDLPTGEKFKKRLFGHFGGFTPEISKKLGR